MAVYVCDVCQARAKYYYAQRASRVAGAADKDGDAASQPAVGDEIALADHAGRSGGNFRQSAFGDESSANQSATADGNTNGQSGRESGPFRQPSLEGGGAASQSALGDERAASQSGRAGEFFRQPAFGDENTVGQSDGAGENFRQPTFGHENSAIGQSAVLHSERAVTDRSSTRTNYSRKIDEKEEDDDAKQAIENAAHASGNPSVGDNVGVVPEGGGENHGIPGSSFSVGVNGEAGINHGGKVVDQNATAGFVNPREALGVEGEGEGEGGGGGGREEWQRRLTFGQEKEARVALDEGEEERASKPQVCMMYSGVLV